MKKIYCLVHILLLSTLLVDCEDAGVLSRGVIHFATLTELLEEIDLLQVDVLAVYASSGDIDLISLVQKVRELREFGQELQELSTTGKDIVLGGILYSTVGKAQEALESQLAAYRNSYEMTILFLDVLAINKEKQSIADALKSARAQLVKASSEKEKAEKLKALVEVKKDSGTSVSEEILTEIETAVGEAAEAVSAAENVLKLLEREASSVSLVGTTVNPEGGTTGDVSTAEKNAAQAFREAQAAYTDVRSKVVPGIATLIEINSFGKSSPPPPPPPPPPSPQWVNITNATELVQIGTSSAFPLSGNYRLMADISLTGDWSPIGSPSDPFTGKFDGNGKTISGLKIDPPGSNYRGLFAQLGNATQTTPSIVENLTIDVDKIEGLRYVGALAGVSYAEIENVTVQSGTIIGTSYVGGLVGVSYAEITKVTMGSGTIRGIENVGGLIGQLINTSIHTSSAGNEVIVGGNQVGGGLIGSAVKSHITNSYATGKVSGPGKIGGLVGKIDGDSEIEKSYVTGEVNGTGGGGTNGGGLVGEALGSIFHAYFDMNSTLHTNGVGVGSSHETERVSGAAHIQERSGEYYDMKGTSDMSDDRKIFIDWNFVTIWQWIGDGQWPTLQ